MTIGAIPLLPQFRTGKYWKVSINYGAKQRIVLILTRSRIQAEWRWISSIFRNRWIMPGHNTPIINIILMPWRTIFIRTTGILLKIEILLTSMEIITFEKFHHFYSKSTICHYSKHLVVFSSTTANSRHRLLQSFIRWMYPESVNGTDPWIFLKMQSAWKSKMMITAFLHTIRIPALMVESLPT